MKALFCTILSRAARRAAGFAKADQAIAAVEFGIIMPVLILFTLGAGEASRYVNVTRQLTSLAYAEANLVAERPTGSAAMTANDILFVEYATPVNFPAILPDAIRNGYSGSTGWMKDIGFTISSVVFTATPTGCTSGCTYVGNVAWSVADTNSAAVTSVKRSCVVPPTAASDTAEPSATTLPSDVFTSGSLIVVDLVYKFKPVFGSAFFPTVTLRRSAYVQPRYLTSVLYSGTPSC